jgi:hypothetical protein
MKLNQYIRYEKLHVLEFVFEECVILDRELLDSQVENFYGTIYKDKILDKYNKYACSLEIFFEDSNCPATFNLLIKYNNIKEVLSILLYFLSNFKDYTPGYLDVVKIRFSYIKL